MSPDFQNTVKPKVNSMLSNKVQKRVSIVLLSTFMASCATPPSKISATYVSPLQYSDYSCTQIKGELQRVNEKLIEITGAQQKEADKDAAAMGVGLILFWPALFFLMGEDKKEELGKLKGEYDALESVAIKKECDIADDLRKARQQREEFERKEAEKKKALEEESENDF